MESASASAPTPASGELRVRVAATAVNFHDIFTRRGMPGVKIRLPVIVGSDVAGTVDALGPGVDPHWLGKRVLIDPVMRDGNQFGARAKRGFHILDPHLAFGCNGYDAQHDTNLLAQQLPRHDIGVMLKLG